MKLAKSFLCCLLVMSLAGCGSSSSDLAKKAVSSVSQKVNELAPSSIPKETLDRYSVIAKRNNLNESQLRDIVAIFIKCGLGPERLKKVDNHEITVGSLSNECDCVEQYTYSISSGKLVSINASLGSGIIYADGKVKRNVSEFFFKKENVEKVRNEALKKYKEYLKKEHGDNFKDVKIASALEFWYGTSSKDKSLVFTKSEGENPTFPVLYDFSMTREIYGQEAKKINASANFLVTSDGKITEMNAVDELNRKGTWKQFELAIKGVDFKINGAPGYINDTEINFRESPSTRAKILGVFNKDEKVTILGSSGDWINIKRNDGKVGWVHRKFVAKNN